MTATRKASKSRLLKKLATAIKKVADPEDNGACEQVIVRKDNDTWILLWEGYSEWTMITAGSSLFAGELGTYSTPTEPAIAKVIQEISDAGLFLEAINHYSIAIYEA